MRKIFLLLLTLTSISFIAFSQKNGTVHGVALDTLVKQPVANATVTLMLKKDSSLVSFTMTDNSGRFEITNVPAGEYRLLITHVSYHNTTKFFKIDEEHKSLELGNLIMNDKRKVLNEVVVTSEAPPVTLVGDTIQ